MIEIIVALIESAPLLTLIFLSYRYLQDRQGNPSLFDRVIDELAEVRAAAVGLLRSTQEVLDLHTATIRTDRPELGAEEEAPATIPEEVLDWINLESEVWARAGLERRARSLFNEYHGSPQERWTQVLVRLQVEENELDG